MQRGLPAIDVEDGYVSETLQNWTEAERLMYHYYQRARIVLETHPTWNNTLGAMQKVPERECHGHASAADAGESVNRSKADVKVRKIRCREK